MPINRLAIKERVATYGAVLLDAANEAGGQDGVLEVRDQLEQVIGFTRSNMDLSNSLEDSAYSPEQRNGLARSVFEGFSPVLVDVIAVMAERGDIALLDSLQKSYETQIAEKLGVTIVDVTTVVPLDDRLRTIIIEKAESDLGGSVVLREHIDPSILGGITMSANGKRIDASVLSQLESARTVLKTTTDGGEC